MRGVGKDDDYSWDFRTGIHSGKWINALFARLPKIDCLINNAGMMELGTIKTSQHEYSQEQFVDSLLVNLIAPYLFIQHYVRCHEKGRVINTASMAFKTPGTRCPGYVASKAGLEAMTRAFARELAGKGWVFASIAPNVVEDTPMSAMGLKHLQDERGMTLGEAIRYMTPPLCRNITHEELCKVFQFAVEEMPEAMTGTTLCIPAGTGI